MKTRLKLVGKIIPILHTVLVKTAIFFKVVHIRAINCSKKYKKIMEFLISFILVAV